MTSFGDFFIGCYLFIIAVYDGVIYKEGYCRSQIQWIMSNQCSIIGVLSTIGSQISLFSMTVLSFVRLNIIWNSKKIRGKITLTSSLQVLTGVTLLIIASVMIAVIPIVERFEDFFVNGVHYSNDYSNYS